MSRFLRDDLELLVSELVTNSVRHSGLPVGSPIDVSVERINRSIHVEVSDRGPGFERPDAPPATVRESGWGLHLVDQIAASWGVRVAADRVVTWFDLPATPSNGGGPPSASV
jgi:anti-sigma regulatory factor (Ser/Thr protein kinase)